MKNKGIVWIDYARFIGILLVVFGHAMQRFPMFEENLLYKNLWNFIYLFHMPLFFVISGYLYKPLISINKLTNIKNGGGKIWRQLIIPYLIYQILFLPLALIQYRNELYDLNTIYKLFDGIVMGDGYRTPLSIPVNLPCWFILSIIQLRLLFMWIPLNIKTSCLFSFVSIVFLILRKVYDWDLYFCLDSTIMAIPYFIIGYYLAKTTIIERIGEYKIGLIPICVILLCLILYYNGPVQMNGPIYRNSVLWNYIAGFTGTMMVFMLSQWFANKWGNRDYVHIVSRNTLFIIFSHWVLLSPCSIIADRLPTVFTDNLIITFMMAICVSVIVLCISKLIIDYNVNKYPILFGKQK